MRPGSLHAPGLQPISPDSGIIESMHNILVTLFAWPAGILIGNLIANLAWLPVQWAGLHLKLAAHHAEIMERLDACPHCGRRRSEADLLSGHEPS